MVTNSMLYPTFKQSIHCEEIGKQNSSSTEPEMFMLHLTWKLTKFIYPQSRFRLSAVAICYLTLLLMSGNSKFAVKESIISIQIKRG